MNSITQQTTRFIKGFLKASQSLVSGDHTFSQIANRAKYETTRGVRVEYEPWHLTIYPTDRCTLKCKMCLHSSRNQELDNDFVYPVRKDMTLDMFRKILERFKKVTSIDFAGIGEPFLNKDLLKMVEYATSRKMKVEIVTNGTLIDRFSEKIINSKIKGISVSLNAINPQEYSNLTGVPQRIFDLVMNNVSDLVRKRNLGSSNLRLGLSFVTTKSNVKQIPEMVRIARSLKVDHLDFHSLIPSESEGLDKQECLFQDDPEVKEFFDKECKRLYDDLKINYPKLLKRNITERKCKMPFYLMGIDAEGNISAGCRVLVPSEKFGNVFKDEDVWNNQHMKEIRRMFLDESVPLMEACKLCVENC